jgi:hypothetical protein
MALAAAKAAQDEAAKLGRDRHGQGRRRPLEREAGRSRDRHRERRRQGTLQAQEGNRWRREAGDEEAGTEDREEADGGKAEEEHRRLSSRRTPQAKPHPTGLSCPSAAGLQLPLGRDVLSVTPCARSPCSSSPPWPVAAEPAKEAAPATPAPAAPATKPFFDPAAPAPTVDPTKSVPEPSIPEPEKKKKPVVPERKKKKEKK